MSLKSIAILSCMLFIAPCMKITASDDIVSLQWKDGDVAEKITAKDFEWMTGVWRGKGLGGECEEVWSGGIGSCMVGSFVFAHEGAVVFSEHFSLHPLGDSLTLKLKHFDEKLVGWEEKADSVEFKFIKRSKNRFHFSGLTYVSIDDKHMDVYVLMKSKDGSVKEEKFEFTRVK